METLDTVISVTIEQIPMTHQMVETVVEKIIVVVWILPHIEPIEAAAIYISVSALISLVSYYPKLSRLYGLFEIESSNIARRISEKTINYNIFFFLPLEIVGFTGLVFYLVNKLPFDEIFRILFISVLVTFFLTEKIKWYYCRYLETNTTNLSASSAIKIFNGNDLQNLLDEMLGSFSKKPKLNFFFYWFLKAPTPPPAVTQLIEALQDESPEVRWRAAEALGRIGDSIAISPLLDVLMDEYWKVRLWTRISLVKLGRAEYSDQIILTLNDEDSMIREEASCALGNIGEPWSIEALIYLALQDESPGVRWRAAEALGRIGDLKSAKPLIESLKDEVWWVRRVAAEALGEIGDVRAVEPLIRLLDDSCMFVRWSAAKALGTLGDERAVEPLIYHGIIDNEDIVKEAVAGAFVQIGESAVGPLIKALKNEDSGVREMAAEALGGIGDLRAVEPLIESLKDEVWWVRRVAAEALGKIGDLRAAEPLIESLKDESEWVRLRATTALGDLGDPRTFNPLTKALKDKSKYVRSEAEATLKKIRVA